MNNSELKELLKKSWSEKTTADPMGWSPKNPAWGQCAVTALVVQDFFGGKLLRTMVKLKSVPHTEECSHYWNLLPNGREIDLTREQFPEGTIVPNGEPRNRQYVLSFAPTRARYTLLRLGVENQIQPNPLFSDPIYQKCFEAALTSECQKMTFGCVVVYKKKVVAATSNKIIEPLRTLCKPECIRLKIQSRTESMLGACGHAEEWALREVFRQKIPPELCSFYIAGFDAKTNQPWIKKETKDYTCLRCAVQLFMAGAGKIRVPCVDHWESLTPEEAVKTSKAYALKEKKI